VCVCVFLKWYWLTWVVPDRGLLNSYSNVVVVIFCKLYVFKVFRGHEFVVLYIKDYQRHLEIIARYLSVTQQLGWIVLGCLWMGLSH